ncbi:TnsA-like heteromeric transposase endonuclease subunit [Curtobacterium sp. ISL-83]|uniref:TnsA-like heteromeric transposase endonuclease subunit n=1 Tax=Curtobacterium sp. ISL-83 TaxID=2819145 RepID=UPI001BEC1484|nr:TnsA-like heteromeric transposase endonuclease subunit [Curtobacterium sp. ISL-83]MBT2501523.1 TnsA-like heteromeric transposase endonuclease subunit [Curtobacterium sp. ISL-83]
MSQAFNYYGLRPNGGEARTGAPSKELKAKARTSGRTWVMWRIGDEEFDAPATSEILELGLFHTRRVRTPRRRPDEPFLTGFYWFSSTGEHVWFNSQLEADVLRRFDQAGDIVAVAAQPATLVFPDGKHWHVLDYLVLDDRGRQRVLDVKYESKLGDPEVQLQFSLTAEVCAAIGWGYEIHTELPDLLHRNQRFIMQCNKPWDMPPRERELELASAAANPLTVLEAAMVLCPADIALGRTYFYNLVWRNEWAVDLTQPLSDISAVWKIR